MMLESIVSGNGTPYDDAIIKKNDCSKYDLFSINIYTLCRNILSACKSSDIENVSVDDLRAVLISEISYINAVLKGIFRFVEFYYCEYNNLQSKFPKARLMSDNTDKQKHVTYLIVNAVSRLIASQKEMNDNDYDKVKLYHSNYEPQLDKNTLIFTNQAFNLISFSRSANVALIESHTAHIKSRPLWYSKLHTCKQETWVPFNHVTIQLFGDGNLFQAYPKEHRQYVIEIGKKFEWNHQTTLDRMRLNVSFDRQNPIRHEILDLF
jgi:hypothetical protein